MKIRIQGVVPLRVVLLRCRLLSLRGVCGQELTRDTAEDLLRRRERFCHIGVDYTHRHVTATAVDCVALMDRCGIEKACTSAPSFLGHDFRDGNRLIYDVVKKLPGRLIGFCVADPKRSQESVHELDRWLSKSEFAAFDDTTSLIVSGVNRDFSQSPVN